MAEAVQSDGSERLSGLGVSGRGQTATKDLMKAGPDLEAAAKKYG